jgi:hypothetical protein
MWHAWEKREILTEFGSNSLKKRKSLDGLGVDGTIIAQWILSKYDIFDASVCGWEPAAGSFESVKEPLFSVKYGEFLGLVKKCYILKN